MSMKFPVGKMQVPNSALKKRQRESNRGESDTIIGRMWKSLGLVQSAKGRVVVYDCIQSKS